MRNLMTLSLCALLLVFSGVAVVVGQNEAEDALPEYSRTRTLDDFRTPDVFEGQGQLQWIHTYEHDVPTQFLRLHVQVPSTSPEKSWWLVVLDGNRQVVEKLTASSFEARNSRWTQLIPGRRVTVELRANAKPEGLRIVVDRLNYYYFKPGERVFTTGRNDMRDLVGHYGKDHRYYAYGRPTALVFFQKVSSQTESSCTGFLLTPTLLITNHHCISQNWQLETARAEFGVELGATTREVRKFSKIELPNPDLDFTLLRLASPVDQWSTISFATEPIRLKQQLILVQHPSAKPKSISLVDCIVQADSVIDRPNRPDDFYHLCDTDGGSSGSAVLDEATGKVVGLHYFGIFRPNNMGRNLAVKSAAIQRAIRANAQVCAEIAGCQ
ncbi:MAG TPA: serine protease [Pyrinomonadaceae bacterium]